MTKIITDPKVHQFPDSSEAYDAVNCELNFETGEKVSDGDVLVVASEGIIGVATSAWPVAVVLGPDNESGSFHILAMNADPSDVHGVNYLASWKLARQTAVEDADITGNPHWALQ